MSAKIPAGITTSSTNRISHDSSSIDKISHSDLVSPATKIDEVVSVRIGNDFNNGNSHGIMPSRENGEMYIGRNRGRLGAREDFERKQINAKKIIVRKNEALNELEEQKKMAVDKKFHWVKTVDKNGNKTWVSALDHPELYETAARENRLGFGVDEDNIHEMEDLPPEVQKIFAAAIEGHILAYHAAATEKKEDKKEDKVEGNEPTKHGGAQSRDLRPKYLAETSREKDIDSKEAEKYYLDRQAAIIEEANVRFAADEAAIAKAAKEKDEKADKEWDALIRKEENKELEKEQVKEKVFLNEGPVSVTLQRIISAYQKFIYELKTIVKNVQDLNSHKIDVISKQVKIMRAGERIR